MTTPELIFDGSLYPDKIADPSLVEAESKVYEVPCDEEPLSFEEPSIDCYVIRKDDAEKYLSQDEQINLEVILMIIDHHKKCEAEDNEVT